MTTQPDNDEGRPGEGRPRNDLLAGEIKRHSTSLGVSVPWSSVPDEATSTMAVALRLPDALDARLSATEARLEAVERVLCVAACSGPPHCSLRCPTPDIVAEYHRIVRYVDGVEVTR